MINIKRDGTLTKSIQTNSHQLREPLLVGKFALKRSFSRNSSQSLRIYNIKVVMVENEKDLFKLLYGFECLK